MATQRILQNNRLLWISDNFNRDEERTKHDLERLKAIVHHIELFTQIDPFFQSLNEINKEQALIIVSGSLGQHLVEKIENLPKVHAIFIYCDNPDQNQAFICELSKIKGTYNGIDSICEALSTAVTPTNEDLTPIGFLPLSVVHQEESTVDLNRLEPSFMYTTLYKHILLDMEHQLNERETIINFCRTHYASNPRQLGIVEEFNRDYRADKAIWWYTRECFIYHMLNRALRLLESDIIIDMGFFIHDLHRQLEELHRQQYSDYHGPPLTLYRGQALSIEDFAKLEKTRRGLIAFNCFLSTSTTKSVSLNFAQNSSTRNKMVGILFTMTVDPMIPSPIFADVKNHSYFKKENEVLFSMHTVFRIDNIVELNTERRLFEVQLTLTGEDDPELRRLTNQIAKETSGGTGWDRLAQLLIALGQVNKAEELYLALLKQNPKSHNQGPYYHQLGRIKHLQGKYKEAIANYEKAISIKKKTACPMEYNLADSFIGIGLVYYKIGNYSEALSQYQKALNIMQTIPLYHSDLASCYNNMGLVYDKMGKYSEALSHHEKALDISKKTLPENHSKLPVSYNNIGSIHYKMGENSRALSYYREALTIRKKILPADHRDFADSYNYIGAVYERMKEYSEALSYYNKAITIQENIETNHPSLANFYNNIGRVYLNMKNYSDALSYFEKALAIREKTLPANHPHLASSYNNIGSLHCEKGNYSQALSLYNKALAIYEATSPSNRLEIAETCDRIGSVHFKMGKYSQALTYFERALSTYEDIRSGNHPNLGIFYNNIGATYYALKQYAEAKSNLEKALEINKGLLPAGHPNLAITEKLLEQVNTILQ